MRIFTDASTSGNISGIAFVITDNKHHILLQNSRIIKQSDNNTAELTAVLFALESIGQINEHVTIISDSQYALRSIAQGYHRKHERILIKNIRRILKPIKHATFWTKGHSNAKGTMVAYFNECADHLANTTRKEHLIQNNKKRFKLSKQSSKKKITKQNISNGMSEYLEIIHSIYTK